MWKRNILSGAMALGWGCCVIAQENPAITESAPEAAVAEAPVLEEAKVAVVVHNPVVLARVGEVDEALMDRLKSWAETSLAVPVPLAESLTVTSEKLADVVPVAAAQLGPDDVGMVVLNALASVDEPNGIFRPDERVVVINVTDMREGADENILAWRLERQVIRGICVLMGMEWSPNPESAMAQYQSLEELDRMGRNLDPPWLLKFQERANALGIPLDPDSPINFFRE